METLKTLAKIQYSPFKSYPNPKIWSQKSDDYIKGSRLTDMSGRRGDGDIGKLLKHICNV